MLDIIWNAVEDEDLTVIMYLLCSIPMRFSGKTSQMIHNLPDEWWPTELVRTLLIPRGSLYHWIRQGLVRARQLDDPLHRWVVWADEAEQERLRQYHRRAIGDDFRHRWTDAPLAEQL